MAALGKKLCAQRRRGTWVVALAGLLAVVGCGKPKAASGGGEPPEVEIGKPVIQTVTDYEDCIGRTEASQYVEVRARATGYLTRAPFPEGEDVKKGDLIGELDARTSLAEYEKAKANHVQAEARVRRLSKDLGRATTLGPSGVMSREERDRITGDYAEALAAEGSAKASVEVARVALSHTKVHAPFSGRISRRWVDPGNLIKADDTILTTIVALDPLFIYFDIDERTLLRMQRLIEAGTIESPRKKKWVLDVGLADTDGFELKGELDIFDNKLDPSTGTLRARVRVRNQKELLAPGMFARLRVPVGAPRPSTLVPESALGTDQGQKFLYLLDKEDKVVYRQVKVGRQHGNLRVIAQGVSARDRVIVNGLQRVRPGVKVKIKPASSSADDKATR
jgi:RND family efflux transporter MFP subunit